MKNRNIMIVMLMTVLMVTSVSSSAFNGNSKTNDVLYIEGIVPGISISQVDFMFVKVTEMNSDWGRVEVNIEEITSNYDIDEGFVNIFTDVGWVVQNLFIDPVEGINSFTTYFNLGKENEGEDIKLLSLHLAFTEDPILIFNDGEREIYPVGDFIFNAEGCGEGWIKNTPDPIPVIEYEPGAHFFSFTKPLRDGENVQCARNQCWPMAVANSLQYLENSFAQVIITHDHIIGEGGDDSLVGQLDAFSGRHVDNRTSGGGVKNVPMLEGKFAYLSSNGLSDVLYHKHQGDGRLDDPPPGDFTYAGITSIDESVNGNVTFDWIYEQLKKCADVEIGYFRESGGGHAIRVIGCGRTFNDQWIRYIHDATQTYLYNNNTYGDNYGLEEVTVSVSDLDGDGVLNLGCENDEIGFALAEYRPVVSIGPIVGGFGVIVELENHGPELEPDVSVEIFIEPSLLLFGGHIGKTIDIPSGETVKVKSGLLFGLGPATITVNVWLGEDKIQRIANGLVIGPFVFGIK